MVRATCLAVMVVVLARGAVCFGGEAAGRLEFAARSRVALGPELKTSGCMGTDCVWEPNQTAVVICDMWDQHWCASATRRVAEMAPRMNEVVAALRAQGVLIIHAPSETMPFYEGTPQRRRAQDAPAAEGLPADIDRGCGRLPGEPAMPVDASDGGCDDDPKPREGQPWRRQIASLEIAADDVVSDSGREILNVLAERRIDRVLLMGVHTNMCVVGRSFGLRQLVRAGKQVVLVRDLTDAMYNPRRKPYVSHTRGTELIIGHIEQHICGTTTAADLVGEPAAAHVVCVIGEDEYDTKTTLPAFALSELQPRGVRVTVVHADEAQPNRFPGMEVVREADLVLLSVRRRLPSDEELAPLREHLEAGKPLVGIRTASHAFESREPGERQAWQDFDDQVLGGDYQGHYGNKPPGGPPTLVRVLEEQSGHPLLAGIEPGEWRVTSHLYKNRKLAEGTCVLMSGQVSGEETVEPVTWTHSYRGARVAYTSLGNPEDFELPAFRRLLVNAVFWALEQPARP